MVLQYYENFLGIKSLNSEARRFVINSFNFHWIFTTLLWLTNTFLILYTLENVHKNPEQAYVELAILISVQLLVTILVDYPTGVLGDWIGQRWILGLSAVFYGFGYLILSIIPFTFETTVNERMIEGIIHKTVVMGPGDLTRFAFLIAYILIAVAQSQESGAFDSWFQNNYKIYAPEDADRKVFTELISKKEVSFNIIVTLTIATSGFLIVVLGQESVVFFLQGILFAITPLLIFKIIRDHPSIQREEVHLELGSYLGLLKEGFMTIGQNRVLLLLVIGSAIFASIGAVWFNIMLFTVYKMYVNFDNPRLGLLRACIFAVSTFALFLFGILSKKIKNVKRWMIILVLMQSPALFGLIYVLLQYFPISTTYGKHVPIPYPFTWLRFFVVIVMFSIAILPYYFYQILSTRLYLDIIPDKNRNSVYSLIPTVIAIVSIFTLNIGSNMIKSIEEVNHNVSKTYQTMLIYFLVIGFVGSLIIGYAIYLYEPSKVPVPEIHIPQNRFLAGIHALIPYTIPSPLNMEPTDMDYLYYWPLVGTALADGEITVEEHELLTNILANLKEYSGLLEKACKDNIISPKEREELTAARDKLWKEAHMVAIEKDGISDDESKILNKLLEIIRSLESEEGQLNKK
ncbi:MAG: MFS transporter [Candidatus Hodarchaeales archaeon]